jgi:hypothetical protein
MRAEHACGWRVHLDRHLVGFEFHNRFIGGHGLARLFHPARHGCRADAFAERGDTNFHGHEQKTPG